MSYDEIFGGYMTGIQRVLPITALFLVPIALSAAPGKVTKESITVAGQQRAYFLFVPKGLSGPAPALVLLHGSGHDGSSLIDPWKNFASKEGIILIAPNSRDPQVWDALVDGPEFIYQVVEAVKEAHPVDARRVYLFGHSGGAVFALFLACWESQYFAAVSVHAGGFRQPAEGLVVNLASRKIPLLLVAGTEDQFFPPAVLASTRDLFVKNGFPVELREIPGHDHNYYVVADKINRQVWEFLSGRRLDADPKYEERHFAAAGFAP